jgi:hypothetical protein
VQCAHNRQVWAAVHGTVTDKWLAIAALINDCAAAGGVKTSHRSCREKYDALCKAALLKRRTAESRSGDAESWEEIDELLYECTDATAEYNRTANETASRARTEEEGKTSRQEKLREDTMRKLGRREERGEGKEDKSETSEESGGSSAAKKQRVNVRGLVKQSMEQSERQHKEQTEALKTHTNSMREAMDKSNKLFEMFLEKLP